MAAAAAEAAIEAVAEVGNPTIVATLTVVAALLPMLFVSGLMGPYMSPIPANASAAMVLSFFVAMIITPWLMLRFGKARRAARIRARTARRLACHASTWPWHGRSLRRKRARVDFPASRSALATLASMMLFATKAVTVKLLPFDDKSELQVVVDLPRGSSLEETDRVLSAAADRLTDLPELATIQAYAGTAAPFNFNGLVRHSYLRNEPQQGDLQINLTPKGERHRTSHDIALDVRAAAERI